MQTELILTVVGDDRPGMVQDAANCVREVGGNWLESRMTRLAGKFAGVVRVSLPDASTGDLIEKLESLEGMSIHLEPAGTFEDNPQLRAFTISIIGPDRPGILDEVTRALRKSAISVVELQTRVGPAPMTGIRPFSQRSICSRHLTQTSAHSRRLSTTLPQVWVWTFCWSTSAL